MLDALAAVAVRVALHSADPGGANSASNELTGGGYARQTVAWNAASGGAIDDTGISAFSINAGSTVAYISFWNSAGTVRYAKKAVTSESWTGSGTYTLTDADLDLNDP